MYFKIIAKFFLLILSIEIYFYQCLKASTEFKKTSEQALYDQGLAYRNANNHQLAINCFQPLAVKGYVKAQHNLAMQYLAIDKNQEAYQWFKCASEQDFKPSYNNLKKMNILYLVLPNEILSLIASNLNMNELMAFKRVSTKTYGIVNHIITSTHYQKSELTYAQYIRDLLEDVIFNPQPESIRLSNMIEAPKSIVEIRFRDSTHLRKIVDQTPHINSKETCYVLDKNVEDGQEIISQDSKITKKVFINITANEPLIVRGHMSFSNLTLRLPVKSDFNNLNVVGKNACLMAGTLEAFEDAVFLANMIENFEDEVYCAQKNHVYSLLENNKLDRQLNPHLYPDLKELCPDHYLLSGSSIHITQMSHVTASGKFVYVADTFTKLQKLRSDFNEFGQSIGFINHQQIEPNMYCQEPLSLRKVFNICVDGTLIILGKMHINDYDIAINTSEYLWLLGCSLHANSVKIKTHSFYADALDLQNKPEKMSDLDWLRIIKHICNLNGYQINLNSISK